jgi:tetratricopeptide (TPR) repeat protein
MSQPKLLLIAAFCLLLQACATPVARPTNPDAPPSFGDSSRFGPRPDILTPEDLHRLTPEQEADFSAYYYHHSRDHLSGHKRLYGYLERIVANFSYRGDTLTASESFASRSGNCLSLAILTTALAQLARLDIAYQLMDDQPVYEYEGSIVRKGLHVSSLIRNPDWVGVNGGTSDLFAAPGIRIDYFPSLRGRFVANLDTADYLALYYSNIASDATMALDYGKAYWYLLEALKYVPNHGASLNMLAVVNRRVGDIATAESIYRYGIAHAQDSKLSLLKNYHTLLAGEGRMAEAELIQQQLDTMNDPSPFHWLKLARESHEAGDWNNAIGYYRRALELGPFMHEAHLGLALTYYAVGSLRNAEQALRDAADTANRASTRTLYEAKLAALSKEL